MDKNFESIFNLMKISFPEDEYRTYENQKKILENEKYSVIVKKDEKENLIGFISFWKLDGFNFIEHFAVDPNTRGQGIGSKMIKDFVNKSEKPTILEVELPENEISKKRIKFYEKNGFFLNSYEYFQKPLRKNSKPQKMYLMSYPKEINNEQFLKVRKEIYENVYKNT